MGRGAIDGSDLRARSETARYYGSAVMVALTVVLALSSHAFTGPDAPNTSQVAPVAASDAAQVTPVAALDAATVVAGVTYEADTALASLDAAIAAATATGRDGGTIGLAGTEQPPAIEASSPGAVDPGSSAPIARWVWALLVLGVAAAVLLTSLSEGFGSERPVRRSGPGRLPRRRVPAT